MEVDSPGIIGIGGESSYGEEEVEETNDQESRDLQLDVIKPYIHENDRGEALELDGKNLPQDYLIAQLALTNQHKKSYVK